MPMQDNQTRETAQMTLAKLIARSEAAQAKFAPGTAQHTLQQNRIHALRVATSLLAGDLTRWTYEDLERARAPLASLISKSEKARQKLSPGSWQHTMLTENLNALHLAAPRLDAALHTPE